MLSRSTPSFEKEFIASPQSLYDCFLAVPFLRIHHWQRPFEWPEQLAKQLVTSIIDSSLRNEDQYFVGSLFFARDPGPPQCFQVVDGAQRLTTLWLTIASVYRILSQALEQVKSSSHRSDIFDSRDRLWNMIVTKSHQCRVAWLRSGKDEEDMRDVLSYVNSDSDLSAKSLKERAEIGKRRLLSAFVHLHDELLGSFGHSISAVQKFANFMAERVFALCVTVDEPQRAMSIFSVLNSPSMRLSDADLLRAELLQREPASEAEEIALSIRSYEFDYHTQQFLTELLRTVVVAACNPERLKNQDSWTAFRFFQFFMREGTPLYRTRDLRAQTQSASKDLRLLWFHLRRSFSELQPTENSNSPKFIQAIWSEVAAISRGESPWRHGEMTANTPNSHCPSWFACLVVAHVLTRGASYNTCHLLPAKFDNSFENYITLIELQLLACAFKASSFAEFDETLEVIFSNWLVLLLAGKTPDVNVSDLRAKLFKRMDKKPGKQRVKWPLCFLLKRLALAEPTQGWSILLTAVKWDVDHICPQSIHAGTDFATWWPSLAEREEWLHRLGNLTLLPPSANRAKQNGSYAANLEMLCHGPPGLIKELQRNDKFDLAVLRARHERLMATAHKLWDQPTAAIIKPTTKRAKWKQKGEEILPASVQFQFWATESSRCIHVNNSRHCHGEPMTKLLEYVRLRKEGYTHCNTRGCFNRIAAKDVLKQAGLDPKIADD